MPVVSLFTRELALRTYEGLGGARSLTCAIMVRYECWDDLSELKVYPDNYCDADAFARAAAATGFLKKFVDLPTTCDRAERARQSFIDGEHSCYKANERLTRFLPEFGFLSHDPEDASLLRFFRSVRKRVTQWIGRQPPDFPVMRFGPGSTYSDRGGLTTIPDKMDARSSVTPGARVYMPFWYDTLWGRNSTQRRREPLIVRGNRFATVPKDATKDRGIAAEPSLNVCYQLALGRALRNRLKNSTGGMVDLNVAAAIHKRLACDASKSSLRATLDLKNASNSVSYNLVKLCLPTLWFEALESLRSPFTLLRDSRRGDDGGKLQTEEWLKLEMFSSMGNGYTFELETILFAALCCEALHSCGLPSTFGKDVYVFGDDIIVPTDGVRAVTAVLTYSGFELNLDKSFSKGNFRESCGGDFFNGVAVRPYYLKEEPHEPQEYIVIANGLRALDHQLSPPLRGDTGLNSLMRAWLYCLDQLPSQVRRCRGPNDLGDIVIHDNPERWTTRSKPPEGDDPGDWQQRQVMCYRPTKSSRISWSYFHPSTVLASAVYGEASNGMEGVSPRNPTMSYRVCWIACP